MYTSRFAWLFLILPSALVLQAQAVSTHTAGTPSTESTTPVPKTYTITEIGTLGGDYISVSGVNDRGQVAGASTILTNAPIPPQHAFLWQDGKMTDLGTLGGRDSVADALNNNGQVVGSSNTIGGSEHAFIWQNGKMTDLDRSGSKDSQAYSQAWGVNNEGQIVGLASAGNGREHAFLWQNGQMTDLGTFGGSANYSQAYAVNNELQVVGVSTTADGRKTESFLWQHGRLVDIGSLGPFNSVAEAINDKAQVVGGSDLLDGTHAFLWQGGQFTDLGTLGGSFGEANAINNKGQVVGSSGIANSAQSHAFVWQDGRMTDLNALMYTASDWTLEAADGINNLGQIVGQGLRNGQQRGFLLTPVPEGSGDGRLLLSNNSWTFGPHPVGQSTGSATIYLTNSGTGDLHIYQIRIGARNANETAGDFKITSNTCAAPGSRDLAAPSSITLVPHEFCAVTFNLTASVGGARTADLVVYDDAPDGPHALPVNGTGVGKGNLVLSSDSWTFGGHAVGQASGPGTINIHNSGTDAIHFASIAIVPVVGELSTDFAIRSNTCGVTLAGSKTCTVTFVFTPTVPGDRYSTLIFTDDSANSPQTVQLTGYGH